MSYLFAESDHSSGRIEGLVGDVVGLQLKRFELGQRRTFFNLTVGCHLYNEVSKRRKNPDNKMSQKKKIRRVNYVTSATNNLKPENN